MKIRRRWTDGDLATLRRQYPTMRAREIAAQLGRSEKTIYLYARKLGLKKSPEFLAELLAEEGRRLRTAGAPHRYTKGHVPWSAGRKGVHHSPATEFRKGHKPQTWQPVGTEVVDRDGYRKRKVRDDAPRGMSRFNWRFVHIIVWEEAHGPVPKGHAVVFRNRDRSDIRIENLELVTRQALMMRNTVHNLPGELKEVVMLKKTLTRAINRRANGKQDHRPA